MNLRQFRAAGSDELSTAIGKGLYIAKRLGATVIIHWRERELMIEPGDSFKGLLKLYRTRVVRKEENEEAVEQTGDPTDGTAECRMDAPGATAPDQDATGGTDQACNYQEI